MSGHAPPLADIPAPFEQGGRHVLPEWIDGNGHMNVAWYVRVFDDAFEEVLDHLGLGHAMVATHGLSVMAADLQLSYKRELLVAQPLRTTSRLVALDRKRMRWQQEIHRSDTGELAATADWLHLLIDMNNRRVTTAPDAIFALLEQVLHTHEPLR